MYQIIDKKPGSDLGIQISGMLTREDYKEFQKIIEHRIEEHGKISVLIELKDFQGLKAGAVWEDLKFDLKHRNDFNRVAIVGQQAWMQWMTQLSKLFFNAEIKYYQPDELDKAWLWIHEKAPQPVL